MATPIPAPDTPETIQRLLDELGNFQDIARHLIPTAGEVPRLRGFDIAGRMMPLNGAVGGDHVIYIDFKQRFDLDARIARASARGQHDVVENLRRCQRAAGIALVDVAGHRMTDALLAAMFHQAFLLGATYELDMFGTITQRLFENLNTRFYQSSGAHKFISLIYGEISEDARFRFMSAAHVFPSVFSRQHDRFMEVGPEQCVSFPPLGLQPSLTAIDRGKVDPGAFGFKERYALNEWHLMGKGDILLLHTDGFVEHTHNGEAYFPERAEATLRSVKDKPAKDILKALDQDLRAFGPPSDDISLVVIKLA
ncbi:MAG: PP2C family protein-serine/threonine phosphatase [Vicinamibacterales bacterium]